MSPASRTLRVRLLGFLAAAVVLIAALELASFGLFYAAAGRRFSYEEIAREQAAETQAEAPPPIAVLPGPDPAVAPTPQGPAIEGRPEKTPAVLVPHPFMGFTYDPENAELRARQGQGALPLTEHGFFSLSVPPGQGEELSVAVFGGSVAAFFAVDGREGLRRALETDPILRRKRVRMHCFALGGFKQPQMLGALGYLMALGHQFDVVVVLDGFNDVALSFVERKVKGTFPGYPRDWDGLVGQSADLDRQRAVGKVAYLQQWRASVARRFSRPPLSWSVTGALVWKSLNRLLGSELARAREDLATRASAGLGYRERGPLRPYSSDRELLADIARLWASSSVQMQRLCAGAGTRYHHFLQPNQYLPGSKPLGEAEKAVAYRADHPYRVAVEAGYPVLRAEGARLAERGVDFHDLTALYAGIAEPLYVDDCCHVNGKGNALMGEAVGKALVAGWGRAGLSAGATGPAPR